MKKCLIILFLCSLAVGAQLSFKWGRMSPLMKYRVDMDNHSMGSEQLENILVRAKGMAYKRPGTEYIDDANDTVNVRLVPFEYSTNDADVLEFSHKYIGFLRTSQ